MRVSILVSFAGILLLLSALAGSIYAESSASYGFDVTIGPDPEKSGVFLSKLVVTSISSGEVIVAPAIRSRKGQKAETSSGNFRFMVMVEESGSSGEYKIEMLEGDTILSRSQARVTFKE